MLEHELGHVIGLSDNTQAGDLMDITLGLGVRRAPTAADLATIAQASSTAVAAPTAEATAYVLTGDCATPATVPVQRIRLASDGGRCPGVDAEHDGRKRRCSGSGRERGSSTQSVGRIFDRAQKGEDQITESSTPVSPAVFPLSVSPKNPSPGPVIRSPVSSLPTGAKQLMMFRHRLCKPVVLGMIASEFL